MNRGCQPLQEHVEGCGVPPALRSQGAEADGAVANGIAACLNQLSSCAFSRLVVTGSKVFLNMAWKSVRELQSGDPQAYSADIQALDLPVR